MSLRTADYDYALPENLIARYPTAQRDGSRLMLLDRGSGRILHHRFSDLIELLRPDELLVLNDTKVIPARIRFPDRNAELLLLEKIDPCTWRCLVRPGKSFPLEKRFEIRGYTGQVILTQPDGDRIIRFDRAIQLDEIGEIPLPPYIERSPEVTDRERYQTVYAARPGAVAAPTAGLHFTPEILDRAPHSFITLHVGAGTFRPVKTDLIADHHLHTEMFELTDAAALKIQSAKEILAVGTTTARTLETLMQRFGRIQSGKGTTDLFIHHPFRFQRVNSLLTNFHLPKSTLLMLVAAFGGREFILEAYAEAVRARYRFFSYGDCMLIR